MKASALAGGVLVLLCVAELWVLAGQHRQLAGLRDEKQRLEQQGAVASPTSQARAAEPESPSSRVAATPEMLRLRAEVTRLEGRRRDMAYVATENGKLRVQLTSAGTNGGRAASGYIRASEARLVGYNSPEDTLQSLLWAMHNHDSARFLQAMTAEEANKLSGNGNFAQEFEKMDALVGMRIVETRPLEDGSVSAKIQINPGLQDDPEPMGGSIKFQRVNGEWKIAGEFNEVEQ